MIRISRPTPQRPTVPALLACAATACAAVLTPAPAGAQDVSSSTSDITDIIVTAQRREQRLSEVPLSISVVGTESLNLLAVDNDQSIFRNVPGVAILDLGRQSNIVLRGIATAPDGDPNGSATAVFFGDSPISGFEGSTDTPRLKPVDLARIEVLRGPQGTLYGAGSMSGTIRYIPNDPDASGYSGNVNASLKSVQGTGKLAYDLQGVVNIPIQTDKFAVRLVGYADQDPSWIFNRATGKRADGTDTIGGRIMAKYDLAGSGNITAFYAYNDFNSGGPFGESADLPRDVADTLLNNEAAKSHIANITGNFDFRRARLTIVSTLLQINSASLYGWPDGALTGEPFFYDSSGRNSVFTQEARLAELDGQGFDWLVGGFYQDEKVNFAEIYTDYVTRQPVTLDYDGAGTGLVRFATRQTVRQLAAFFDLSYHFESGLSVNVGGRYADFRKTSEDTTFLTSGDPIVFRPEGGVAKGTSFNPKVNISYRPTENLMVYAQAAKGFRIGGFAASLPPGCPAGEDIGLTYDSDTLWTYEGGVKAGGRKGQIAVSIFQTNWNGLPTFFGVPCPGQTEFLVTNVGNARIRGIEMESTIRVVEGLTASLNGSYIDGKITTLRSNFDGAFVGEQLPGSPRVKLAASLDSKLPITDSWTFFGSAGISYTGRYPSGLSGDFSDFATFINNPLTELVGTRPNGGPLYRDPGSGDFVLVNASAGFGTGRFRVDLFVDNLLNSRERVLIDYFGDTRSVVAVNRLTPRTIGARASVQF